MQKAAQQTTTSTQTNLLVSQITDENGKKRDVLWKGADPFTDTTSNNPVNVTVVQTKPNAYLQWGKFDLGQGSTLNFDQKAGGSDVSNWIAFNYVRDPSANPSQILGTINAAGQVYILNANGILFGGTSQVNTHTLVASSLPINPNLLRRGLLIQKDGDIQFLFSALASASGFDPAVAVDGVAPAQNAYLSDGKTIYGAVTVAAGAQLTATDDKANHLGGRIALIGPNVTNAGLITTDDGQAILAAGLQVGLGAHSSTDPTIRGLDVYVGKVTDEALPDQLAGVAINDVGASIQAYRGNITMTGAKVQNNGVIDSTTSVSLNGSIVLSASFNAMPFNPTLPFRPTTSGTVTLGDDSVIRIQPLGTYDDSGTPEKIGGSKLTLQSVVSLRGKSIQLGRDSVIYAPSGETDLWAGEWIDIEGDSSKLTDKFLFTGLDNLITLAPGATIDVAGLNETASALENFVQVELRGPELANSPLLRNNPALRGKTVTVDIRKHGAWDPNLNDGSGGYTWIGTPLADATGYANLVQRTVEELSTDGGEVNIQAGGSVAMAAGSRIDVSGGVTTYTGATVETTKLLYQGKWIDIASATPDRSYSGIWSDNTTIVDSKWNAATTWASPQLSNSNEAEYFAGGDGGVLAITALAVGLDGTLVGRTTAGQRQLTARPVPADGTLYHSLPNDYLPAASSLALVLTNQSVEDLSTPNVLTPQTLTVVFSADKKEKQESVVYTPNAKGELANLSAERVAKVVLSPEIFTASGFGQVSIDNPGGDVLINSDLVLPAGGDLSVNGLNITIAKSVQITAPGGSLSFTTNSLTPEGKVIATTPTSEATPSSYGGLFQTGGNVILSTAGKQIALSSVMDTVQTAPRLIDGGSIIIKGPNLMFGNDNQIDVSGGILVTGQASPSWGKGGTITVDGGREMKGTATTIYVDGSFLGFENLRFKGYSGVQGGKLNLVAPYIQIGGQTLASGDPSGSLWLEKESDGNTPFFEQGDDGTYQEAGFATFSFSGVAGASSNTPGVLIVGDRMVDGQPVIGANIAPEVRAWTYKLQNHGVELASYLPDHGVRKPANLSFKAIGARNPRDSLVLLSRGDLVMETGATIRTDPGASAGVTLQGNTVYVDGLISSPGGKITISGGKTGDASLGDPGAATEALVTVQIGADAELLAVGQAVSTKVQGYQVGSVLDGGQITVAGNIVAEKGARLDVSGSSSLLDVLPEQVGLSVSSLEGDERVRAQIDSNGGKISFTGKELLVVDATLAGNAGHAEGSSASSAQGGKLVFNSGFFYQQSSSVSNPATSFDLVLTASDVGVTYGEATLLRQSLLDNETGVSATGGHLATDRFAAGIENGFSKGGFRSVTLGGAVAFRGNRGDVINLSASQELRIGDKGVIETDTDARVVLNAPYVFLGQAFIGPLSTEQELTAQDKLGLVNSANNRVSANFTAGKGSLVVNASSIDLGNLALEGFNQATLKATGGDIRGDGTLSMAGKLTLDAANIYPQTAGRLNLVAYDDSFNGAAKIGGMIEIKNTSGETVSPPLSAGGRLGVYAPVIVQGGVLRAPLGAIILGKTEGSTELDPISQTALPETTALTLNDGSITSVSARIDATTALTLPYGVNLNGNAWIDPTSTDISLGGVPQKSISLSAGTLTQAAGAKIDVSGGGDLLAYRWVSGLGGTKDILASTTSFAIVPGYTSRTNAFASYNTSPNPSNDNLGTTGNRDSGYVNSTLSVGGSIYLSDVPGLAAGYYTLLPARYALLPGAFLVTPKSSITPPTSAVALSAYYEATTGSTLSSYLVRGYQFNALDTTRTKTPLYTSFEVVPQAVVLKRAEYDFSYGNEFLQTTAENAGVAVPRRPEDAGRVLLASQGTLNLYGKLTAVVSQGRGSEVDITSPLDIVIGTATGDTADKLVLDPTSLNTFGAESLLIGGTRSTSTDGTTIAVTAGSIEVANTAATALKGAEIVLAARNGITVDTNASIVQSGAVTGGAETLLLGDNSQVGTGDGVLLRVTSDATAGVVRKGVDATATDSPKIRLEAYATITGTALTLDSSKSLSIDPLAAVKVDNLNLSSQQINVRFSDPTVPMKDPDGLLLTGALLATVQTFTRDLSLTSATSIDLYGTGNFGTYQKQNDTYTWDSLVLHAGSIRGFDATGSQAQTDADATVQFFAKDITLDNRWSATGLAPVDSTKIPTGGLLSFQAQNLMVAGYDRAAGDTGSSAAADHTLKLEQYKQVTLSGSQGVQLSGAGRLETHVNLAVDTPQIAGEANSDQTLVAGGEFKLINGTLGTPNSAAGGLGAKLALSAQTIDLGQGTTITAPSGTVNLQATGSGLSAAEVALTVDGQINVNGTHKVFQGDADSVRYTDAGSIGLQADQDSVALTNNGVLDLNAYVDDEGLFHGSAGTLTIKTVKGDFTSSGAIKAHGDSGDLSLGGAFSLDVRALASTKKLDALLTEAGFTRSQSFRVRTGNVAMDGTAITHSYNLSADDSTEKAGIVTVTGTINAHGTTGGTISISAQNDLVLAEAASLDASGDYYDDAGKGGAISLETVAGFLRMQDNSNTSIKNIILGVSHNQSISDSLISNGVTGNRTDLAGGGTLHLRASQILDDITQAPTGGVRIDPIGSIIDGASSIVVEGYRTYDRTDSGGYITDALKAQIYTDAAAYISSLDNVVGTSSIRQSIAGSQNPKSLHFQAGVEIVNADTTKEPVTINDAITLVRGATSSVLTGTNKIALTSSGSTVLLGTVGSSITPAAASPILVVSAVAANAKAFSYTVNSGTTVTITGPDGVSIAKVKATKTGTTTITQALPAGTTIAFSQSTGSKLTVAGTTATTVPLALSTGTYTTTGSATVAAAAGNLTLLSTWDLSSYRFNNEPGVLTLRATGNLVFPATSLMVSGNLITTTAASLSDGFDPSQMSGNAARKLWLAPLMDSDSWSYKLVSGADTAAADYRRVQPLDQIPDGVGSLLLGRGSANLPSDSTAATLREDLLVGGSSAKATLNQYYQTIRTGTGDITIVTGRDVQLLDPVATIYTAGRKAASNVVGFDNPTNIVTSVNYGATYNPTNGYGMKGGNLSITAQGGIVRLHPNSETGELEDASSLQMPSQWLYRRAQLDDNGLFYQNAAGETYSTTWWVDYSNFFDDVATLGGGNVSLQAGQDIRNVNASVATNARLPGKNLEGKLILPDVSQLVELGGGDLSIVAGANLDGGVYYVERGQGVIDAGGSIKTNSTRFVGDFSFLPEAEINQLATTFFVGKARLSIYAGGDLTLGEVANPFLLPQSWTNRPDYSQNSVGNSPRTFFSTFDAATSVSVASLGGTVILHGDGTIGSLSYLYLNVLDYVYGIDNNPLATSAFTKDQPWLRTLGAADNQLSDVFTLMPGTLKVASFLRDIDLHGSLYLSPAASGTVEMLAAGALNGYQPMSVSDSAITNWVAARINLADVSPEVIPSMTRPLADTGFSDSIGTSLSNFYNLISSPVVDASSALVDKGNAHAGPALLHADDTQPVRLYSGSGDISGLTLLTGKKVKVVAGRDITDVTFYLQNLQADDVSVISAGRDIVLYDPTSRLRLNQVAQGDLSVSEPLSGDIQISGPGTLEVLAGRNLDLGTGGTGTGIVSLANQVNPWLPPFPGADIIALAGVALSTGLDANSTNFSNFIKDFIPDPATATNRYLTELAQQMNMTGAKDEEVWRAFNALGKSNPEKRDQLALDIFFLVLRDTGRDYNNPDSSGYHSYKTGRDAIADLFPRSQSDHSSAIGVVSSINLASKNVRTKRGGSIMLLDPFGKIDLGFDTPVNTAAPPGVITEYGGKIDIFADQNVSVGAMRIFTLRGGDVTIWSDHGNIAAGFSSKTVKSAPPTNVLIDTQSADVKNDLAGLATGGGIGVLATVAGVLPGDIDLIAPAGVIDAGDAGIRSSGKINVSAVAVLNSANIQSSAGTTGTPVVVVPNISGLTTASTASAGASSSAGEAARQQQRAASQQQEDVLPSIIQVEVLGYGGGEGEDITKKKDDAGNG
jgi:filamentous hemagglutinin family protein